MKRNFVLILAMMLAVQLFAAADGTYKSIVSEYTLGADGGIVQRVKKVLKYNTHKSFNDLFGETFIVYNPDYQKVKIDTSYTIQKDGTVIKTPANAFNYVLPSMAAKAPDYNNLKELVITHTGLELGATAYLEYTITTEPGVFGSLEGEEIIGVQGADIDKYQVVVNIPNGKALRWSITDSKVKPVVKGGRYVWTFTGVKSAKGEANTPFGYGGVPRLSFTTSGSLAETLTPLTVETRDLCQVPSAYLKNAKTNLQRAEAVQKYIVSDIGTCKVSPYHVGNSVRQCGRVMATAYGTEAEKALAMARLMRAEGLDAQAVLAYPKAQEVKTVRNVAEYMVLCEGRFFSARTLGESLMRWRGEHYSVYDLGGNEIELPASDTKISLKGNISMTAQKAVVNCEYTVEPKRGEENNFAQDVTLKDNNGYIIYSLPMPVSGCMDRWGLRKFSKERDAAFELPYKVDEAYEYTVSLDGVKSVTKDVQKSIKNSVGAVAVSIVNGNGKIVIKRSVSLNMAVVPAGKYKEFVALMQLWNNDNYRKVMVKK